jgi:hypothetical protein
MSFSPVLSSVSSRYFRPTPTITTRLASCGSLCLAINKFYQKTLAFPAAVIRPDKEKKLDVNIGRTYKLQDITTAGETWFGAIR